MLAHLFWNSSFFERCGFEWAPIAAGFVETNGRNCGSCIFAPVEVTLLISGWVQAKECFNSRTEMVSINFCARCCLTLAIFLDGTMPLTFTKSMYFVKVGIHRDTLWPLRIKSAFLSLILDLLVWLTGESTHTWIQPGVTLGEVKRQQISTFWPTETKFLLKIFF